jgi:hypothetical protein
MIYTNMLFALALDKIVFGQSPGWWSIAGSGLILGSAVFIAVQKQQSEQVGRADEERGAIGEDGAVEEEMGMLRVREQGHEAGTEEEGAAILSATGRDEEDETVAVGLRDFSPRSA